jgi:DNA-binding LytR/AlgR family response regulator
MGINCIIIDDEPRAHTILSNYISEAGDLVLLASFRNAVEAYKFLVANPVGLIFLDINMPRIDGFGLLDMLETKPMVIMTTAYSEYAAKSYDYNVIDYLQKPIRLERFITAVQKAQKWKQLGTPPAEKFITIKVNGAKQQIATEDIEYIECQGNYAKVVCKNRPDFKALITVKELEDLLPGQIFLRIHRSFIVNTVLVTKADEHNLTIGDANLPIGKTYKKYVEERLKK